jgi:N-acetylmuramoyl-L-alanine amidase
MVIVYLAAMIARRARLAVIGLALACTRSLSTAPAPAAHPADATHLPAVPSASGPLELKVVYPAADAIVEAGDSSFLFGSTGAGDAQLTINDLPVRVWPNGAWLAWLALPRDSVMTFRIVARTPRDSAELTYAVRRATRFTPPDTGLWIDSTSLTPRGQVWLGPSEYLTLAARAAQGAEVHLRLPDGTLLPLTSDPRPDEIRAGVRAFDRDTLNLRAEVRPDHYAGVLRGTRLGDPGPVFTPVQVTAQAPMLEAIRGGDTARVRWPLQVGLLDTLPVVAELGDPGRADAIVVGRAAPRTSYHWFFPTGTRAVVAGRRNDEVRLRLSEGVEAWVAAGEVRVLPPGSPAPRGVAGSIAITPIAGGRGERASIRIPLGARVPFRVDEDDRRLTLTLYRTAGDVSWLRYGTGVSPVRRVTWTQQPGGLVTLAIELTGPVWGYRTRWSGTDLMLEVRRPPRMSAGRPLAGRLIVVDPGHPPGGATGPTGLREAEANLAVALRLQALLEDAGAQVVMTRTADVSVELGARPRLADSLDADLLVSIHNNALPDGVNPLTNNGTSVYYSQPRSLPLARSIQRELVERFGVRDLGVGRADFALTRATWQPAVLCEGLYMIMPDQEAALRNPAGRELYARGVLEGIVKFMKEVSSEQ